MKPRPLLASLLLAASVNSGAASAQVKAAAADALQDADDVSARDAASQNEG